MSKTAWDRARHKRCPTLLFEVAIIKLEFQLVTS